MFNQLSLALHANSFHALMAWPALVRFRARLWVMAETVYAIHGRTWAIVSIAWWNEAVSN
jgi:hypothetical protein